jgi:hypothetical protein
MKWFGRRPIFAVATLLTLSGVAVWHSLAGWDLPSERQAAGRVPRIRPDYSDTVIPPNIAPLNFLVEEPGTEYRVRIYGHAGGEIIVGSRSASIVIPPRPWRELLAANRGGRIAFDVFVKDERGQWSQFLPVANQVAQEEIDSHLVYRLLGPICNLYQNMGIYQRNLENYDESPIVTTDAIDGCMNCHAFVNNRPDRFSLQIRPGRTAERIQAGMIVCRGGHAHRLQTASKATPNAPSYTSWHPGGKLAAFAMSKPMQCFRGAGADVREVFDAESDLGIVDLGTSSASTSPAIANGSKLETFPGWSADGKVLYFGSAESQWGPDRPPTVEAVGKTRFDLASATYDVEKNAWGTPQVLLSAKTGKSISEPRASPDGRYLLFCMSDYGAFPVHQASCDLYMMTIKDKGYRRLECNSPQSDSWHCWSSNSRWIVFSSKRDNGLLARPYFSYIDSQGRSHKPFVLPQRDPAFYDAWLRTYNVPELVSGPVAIAEEELLKAIRSGSSANDEPGKAIPPDGSAYPTNWTRPWTHQ